MSAQEVMFQLTDHFKVTDQAFASIRTGNADESVYQSLAHAVESIATLVDNRASPQATNPVTLNILWVAAHELARRGPLEMLPIAMRAAGTILFNIKDDTPRLREDEGNSPPRITIGGNIFPTREEVGNFLLDNVSRLPEAQGAHVIEEVVSYAGDNAALSARIKLARGERPIPEQSVMQPKQTTLRLGVEVVRRHREVEVKPVEVPRDTTPYLNGTARSASAADRPALM